MKKKVIKVIVNAIISSRQDSVLPPAEEQIYFYFKRNIARAILLSAGISCLFTTVLCKYNSIIIVMQLIKHSIKTFFGL